MAPPDVPLQPAPAPVAEQPAAVVQAPAAGQGVAVTKTFPVRQPQEDWNDFQVGVRATVLRRCRKRLRSLADQKLGWQELLLGVATLAAGASLSAVISGVPLGSYRGAFFYVLMPMVATGTGAVYFTRRRSFARAAHEVSEDVLADLPDPDRVV